MTVASDDGGGGFGLDRAVVWFGDAVIGPFVEFFRRNGAFALLVLTFIGLSRVSDLLFGNIANVFYVDLGYSLLGDRKRGEVLRLRRNHRRRVRGRCLAVSRYGPVRPLLLATALVAITNLCFAALAAHGVADVRYLAGVISADNFAVGFAGTVFIAYFSSLTHAAYTATQYALFTSLMQLPGKLLSGFSGMVVDATDYVTFFPLCLGSGHPGHPPGGDHHPRGGAGPAERCVSAGANPRPGANAGAVVLCRLDEIADPGSREFRWREGDWPLEFFAVRKDGKISGFVNPVPPTPATRSTGDRINS